MAEKMLTLIVVVIFQACILFVTAEKIQCQKIVQKINSLNLPWKADTYGHSYVNMKNFAVQQLGLRLPNLKASKSRNDAKIPAPDMTSSESTDIPDTFSWLDTTRFNCPIAKIRDQSNCGSCWAVAGVSVMGDQICLLTRGQENEFLSADHVVGCDSSNYGCYGGYFDRLLEFLRMNGTVTGGEYESDEGCQPYSIKPCGLFNKFPCSYAMAMNPKCKKIKCTNDWYLHREEKKSYKICGWKMLDGYSDPRRVQQEIIENGPIIAGFLVYQDFLFYKKGVYEHKIGRWPLGGHAVKVLGWGIEDGVKYWLVANSWGKLWGENGFFKIKRGSDECYFESMMYSMKMCDKEAYSN